MKDFMIGMGCVVITVIVVNTLRAFGYEILSSFFLGVCIIASYTTGIEIGKGKA